LTFAATCWIERRLSPTSEVLFTFWTHSVALIPGFLGILLRRGFYSLTLDGCSLNVNIGFGTIFSHRAVVIGDHVSIGNYAVIGSARIGKGCEIASRVSITSGKNQHQKAPDGSWTPFNTKAADQVIVGQNVWIGEGAIIMSNIGDGCLIAAGAVVSSETPANVIAAGNPARTVRNISL
jgi:acetyltransferase-like isoleucine patch superfamily enzyme